MSSGVSFVGGLSTGLDTASIIDQLMYVNRLPIRSLENKVAEYTNDKTAWQMVTANLMTMQVTAYSLSKESTFETKTATSSDEDYFTVSANTTAAIGSYQIEVPQIASSHQLISKGYANQDVTTVGAGTITFEQSGGYINPYTRLDTLNAQQGIGRGSIKIIDRSGSAATIDLSNTITLQDVVDTINNNTDVNVLVSLNSTNTGLNIRDKSGSTTSFLKVYDLSGGTTAQDLGISTGTGGVNRNYYLGSNLISFDSNTDLNILNDGLGVRDTQSSGNDFGIHLNDDTIINIDVTDISTINDLLLTNLNSGDLTTSISNDGLGLKVIDSSSGSNGFYAYANQKRSAATGTVSAGATSITVNDASDFKIGDRIQIYQELDSTSGRLITSEFRTISEVDTQTNTISFTNGLDSTHTDDASHTVYVGNANTISDLGLEFTISATSLKEGYQLVSGINTVLTKNLNGGSSYDDGSVTITDRTGTSASVNLSREITSTLATDSGTDTSIEVNSTNSDFRVGDRIRIVEGSTIEYRTILNITNSGGNDILELDSALTTNFSSGATIYTRIENSSDLINRLNTAQDSAAVDYLTAAITGNPTTISVNSETGFSVGDVVVFAENDVIEYKTIASTAAGAITFTESLENDFSNNLKIWKVADVTASINDADNGIEIIDNTSGTGSLSVAEVADSTASQLGILKSTSTAVLDGDDLDHQWQGENTLLENLNFGSGVYRGKIKITDRSGSYATIDLSSSTSIKTIGDVLNAINSNVSIDVTASINATGDGILITDDTGSTSSNLIISEVNGGSTAKDLNIDQNVAATSIDGTRESTITVSANDTLEDVKDAINDLEIDLKATIINDGSQANPYKLMVTSEQSGTIGRIAMDANLSGGRGLDFTATAAAQDSALLIGKTGSGAEAKLIVKNGTQITDAIQGVTINLIKETTGPESFSVSDDYEGIITSAQNFVDQWNNLNSYFNEITSYDALNGIAGELMGDSSIMTIRSQLMTLITDAVDGVSAEMSTLRQAGISMATDGSMSLNSSELEDALKDDIEKVKDLFTFEQNVALATYDATPSASETNASYSITGAIDNNTNENDFEDQTTGWMSDGSTTPWYEIDFNDTYKLSQIKLFTPNSSTMPGSDYALNGYKLQLWNPVNNAWTTESEVGTNSLGELTHNFNQIKYASKIRFYEMDTTGKIDNNARIIEVQAYEKRGIAGALSELIKTYTDAENGILGQKVDGIDEIIADYNDRIDSLEEIMEIKETRLINQFTQMETVVGNLQNQASWLASQTESLSSGWKK